MSIIAEFTVPTESFTLEKALRADPGTTVELERVVPTGEQSFPYFVAWDCGDYGQFERAARDDPAVNGLSKLDRVDNGVLYRADWSRNLSSFVAAVRKSGATLMKGRGNHRRWQFQLRFPSQESVNAFRDELQAKDAELALDRLHGVSTLQPVEEYGLTREQSQTIVTAYEEGYFEEPRQVSQRELATSLGISSGAVTGRLRRGLSTLVSNTLLPRE